MAKFCLLKPSHCEPFWARLSDYSTIFSEIQGSMKMVGVHYRAHDDSLKTLLGFRPLKLLRLKRAHRCSRFFVKQSDLLFVGLNGSCFRCKSFEPQKLIRRIWWLSLSSIDFVKDLSSMNIRERIELFWQPISRSELFGAIWSEGAATFVQQPFEYFWKMNSEPHDLLWVL